MIRHIALFRINDGVEQSQVQQALRLLQELGVDNENVVSWEAARSLDERKGVVLVVTSLFASEEALERFRPSERHVAVAQFLRPIATWLVADYIVQASQ